MANLYEVTLDIEGNDRGITITTVAADTPKEAEEKAIHHVGRTNNNENPDRKITVLAVEETGLEGCISNHVSRALLQKIAKRMK